MYHNSHYNNDYPYYCSVILLIYYCHIKKHSNSTYYKLIYYKLYVIRFKLFYISYNVKIKKKLNEIK